MEDEKDRRINELEQQLSERDARIANIEQEIQQLELRPGRFIRKLLPSQASMANLGHTFESSLRIAAALGLVGVTAISLTELPRKALFLGAALTPILRVAAHGWSSLDLQKACFLLAAVFGGFATLLLAGGSNWGEQRVERWERWLRAKSDLFAPPTPVHEATVRNVVTPSGSVFLTPFGTRFRNNVSFLVTSAVFFFILLPSSPSPNTLTSLATLLGSALACLTFANAVVLAVLPFVWDLPLDTAPTQPATGESPVLRPLSSAEIALLLLMGFGFFSAGILTLRRRALVLLKLATAWALAFPVLQVAVLITAALRRLRQFQTRHEVPNLSSLLGFLCAILFFVLTIAGILM